MGMDRNSVIGFVLLALLFFGYFYFTRQGQVALEQSKQHIADSIDRVNKLRSADSVRLAAANPGDTIHSNNIQSAGSFKQDSTGREQLSVLENDLVKITFTNKGGQPKIVELKKYKTYNNQPLILRAGDYNTLSYPINVAQNKTAQTSDLLFNVVNDPVKKAGKTIVYEIADGAGEVLQHYYQLPDNEYMLNLFINISGSNKLVTQQAINLQWQAEAAQVEKDVDYEKLQSHIAYLQNDDYDFDAIGTGNSRKFEKPVEWISLKQQFFIQSIISKDKFQNAEVRWSVPADTNSHKIAETVATMKLNVPPASNASIALQLYYGPSDYKLLKSYGNQLQNIVPLGSGIFAFVKYINRGFILPVFNFLDSKIVSYGLVIALLTIIIRLIISPLSYQSYLSGAKMKLLKPEIDELKLKHGDDKQAFGMDQMKLFRSAGVNPLGGCIPALLQIPIFFALYNFFNSNIALRGQSFWWATDLSAYDSIYNLPFHIPFYGNHISLFTILAVVTSLLISLYGMANMQDNSNPVMKYMPFIFPVILLGVFNKLPSALTWYYTVSNVITLLIQFVIQNYIINHEKIMAKLQENKKKPVVKSKWQERIEAMQESNKKIQESQQKTQKKK